MQPDFLRHFKKPSLYERSDGEFWNDDHISGQLLRAHLDPTSEGASRTPAFIEKSAAWIRGAVPPEEHPALLDLGCGPGLYAEKFAQYGYRVTGLDCSRRSVEYARQSAGRQNLRIRYLLQDYLKMSLHEEFDFATMIYCDYGALSADERKILLHNVYMHLKPGGKFLFDVFSDATYSSFREKRTWEICPDGGFWREDGYVALSGHYKYPGFVTLEQTVVLTEKGAASYNIWNTCFSREALIREVQSGGFRVKGIFSDVAGAQYRPDSPVIAILLEK